MRKLGILLHLPRLQRGVWSPGVPEQGHEMSLDLIYEADCGCNPHCKTNPVDLEGSRAKFGRKITENRSLRTLPDSRLHPQVP